MKNISTILELTRINTLVFDKTGTLTSVAENSISYCGRALRAGEQELLAAALRQSAHPLSRTLAETMSYVVFTPMKVTDFAETPAQGFVCRVEGMWIRVGTADFVGCPLFCRELQRAQGIQRGKDRQGSFYRDARKVGAEVHLSIDGEYKGFFIVKPAYRRGLKQLFLTLRKQYALLLLSGDNDAERENLCGLLDISKAESVRSMAFYQTPQEKLERIGELQEMGAVVAMIGDGLNDAGALQQSDVGIALASNSGVFSPACDAVLSAEKLVRLSDFISFAGYTRRVIIAAFWISVLYNAVGLTFAFMGLLSPLVSAVLMPISNATVIGFTTLAVLLGAKVRKI